MLICAAFYFVLETQEPKRELTEYPVACFAHGIADVSLARLSEGLYAIVRPVRPDFNLAEWRKSGVFPPP
jgi:hypothetical protein